METWATSDPRNAQLLEDLRQAWEMLERDEEEALVDVDAAWEKLSERVREAEKVPQPGMAALAGDRSSRKPAGMRHSERKRPRHESRERSWMARQPLRGSLVAAALMIVAGALVLFTSDEPWPESSETAEGKVFTTQRGQRAIIDLTDGTQVHLNADSRLALPDGGFSEGRREVHLDGEAYFEVARDTTRPFRVRTKGGHAIRVLGTAFNVQAYGADTAAVQVAVREGEVALQASSEQKSDSLRLLPHQVGVADAGGGLQAHRNVDLSARLAWTEGRLAFEDAPFHEVVQKLERWYDLRIEVRAPTGSIDRLNAQFDDESLQEILNDIAMALRLRYERTQNTITFYRTAASSTAPGKSDPAWSKAAR